MSLESITPAPALPVTVADAKLFARVETTADDDLIEQLVEAATDHVQQATGRQFVAATFGLTLRCFPYYRCGLLQLPRSPVLSIAYVKYRDTDGTLQTLVADTDYLADLAAEPSTIEPVNTWPATGDYPDAVQVRFTAGYADDGLSPVDYAANVPARAKVAIKALTAHWYENRPAADVSQVYETPMHVSRLINGLRVWR